MAAHVLCACAGHNCSVAKQLLLQSGGARGTPRPGIMTKFLHRLLLSALPLMAACSAIPAPDSQDSGTNGGSPVVEQRPESAPAEEPVEYGSFTREQLELALLSEFGGMRGYLPQASEGYYTLAYETRDPAIVRRAIEFASATGNSEALFQLAELWLELEPESLDAHLLIGYELLEQELYVRALPFLNTVLDLGGSVDFTAMSARTYALDNRQREVIATELQGMVERHPEQASLYYALSQLYDQNGDNERARELLDDARDRFGENPRTALIEAQLLQNIGQAEESEAVLQRAVARYPEHRLLRYSYGQILVQNENLRGAATQFTELLRMAPGDYETLYSLALLNLELDEFEQAESQLRRLLDAGRRLNEARFYLGFVLEQRNEEAEALEYYQQVSPESNAYLSAQRQIMRLFVSLERFTEASEWRAQLTASNPRLGPIMPTLEAEALANAGYNDRATDVLDQALSEYPDDVDLLFARTLLSERSNNMEQVERDLRRIISIDPDDARALNHLGYALTVRTERYEEALALIERAIRIVPDDPAIIDSLGWVQFKLGRYEEALRNLRMAYAAYPDPEVAAHLGEVLWVSGEQEEALEIWQRALEQQPDNEHVMETIQRLVPEK